MSVSNNSYVSREMTNLVLERQQDFGPDGGYVGEKLMPLVPVEGPTGVFNKRSSTWFKDLPDNFLVRGSKSPTQVLPDWSNTTDTYRTQDEADQAEVAKADIDKTSKVIDASRRREIKRAQDALMLNHERRIRAIVSATGTYSTDAPHNFKTGVSGSPSTDEFRQWDHASATPLNDIENLCTELIVTSGKSPDFIVIPKPVWSILKFNTKFLNDAFNGMVNILTPKMFGDYFNIPNVFIPQTIRDSAALGEAASHAFVWTNEVVLGSFPEEPSIECRGFGYTFIQTDLEGGTPSNGPRVRSWVDESRGRGVYCDVVEWVIDRKVCDPTLFMYLKNPLGGIAQLS